MKTKQNKFVGCSENTLGDRPWQCGGRTGPRRRKAGRPKRLPPSQGSCCLKSNRHPGRPGAPGAGTERLVFFFLEEGTESWKGSWRAPARRCPWSLLGRPVLSPDRPPGKCHGGTRFVWRCLKAQPGNKRSLLSSFHSPSLNSSVEEVHTMFVGNGSGWWLGT